MLHIFTVCRGFLLIKNPEFPDIAGANLLIRRLAY